MDDKGFLDYVQWHISFLCFFSAWSISVFFIRSESSTSKYQNQYLCKLLVKPIISNFVSVRFGKLLLTDNLFDSILDQDSGFTEYPQKCNVLDTDKLLVLLKGKILYLGGILHLGT